MGNQDLIYALLAIIFRRADPISSYRDVQMAGPPPGPDWHTRFTNAFEDSLS
jgi:hypothetical protein